MNNDKCTECGGHYGHGRMCPHFAGYGRTEVATPAATTSGAAGTIDTPEFRRLLENWSNSASDKMPADTLGFWVEIIAHIDADKAAAVAAAREEGYRTAMLRALPAVLGSAENVTAIRPRIEAVEAERDAALVELAQLRAAPVVGEAVAQEDDATAYAASGYRHFMSLETFKAFRAECANRAMTMPEIAAAPTAQPTPSPIIAACGGPDGTRYATAAQPVAPAAQPTPPDDERAMGG